VAVAAAAQFFFTLAEKRQHRETAAVTIPVHKIVGHGECINTSRKVQE
jgi:hypothetical protein